MNKEVLQAADRMRAYILDHLEEALTPAGVAAAAGYSERHASRLFRACIGKGIGEYIRLVRLSRAARELVEGGDSVLDVALSHQYDSHEGFTKAFSSAFGISPRTYREGGRPIRMFIPHPVSIPASFFQRKDTPVMQTIITVTIVEQPARKLIVHYSKTGTDYWSYCQEQGCEWEGLLLSIPERLDTPAFFPLPPQLIPAGHACGAVGIEVPAGYAGTVPEGYNSIPLPAGPYAYFSSAPYANEDDFPLAIQSVFAAYEAYNPAQYGYAFDIENRPVFNYGAETHLGARIAVPLRKLQK